jgi:hypothetical protein
MSSFLAGCSDGDAKNPAAGSGGEGGGPGSTCAEQLAGPLDPAALIDDFEDGDSQLLKVANRSGSWWLATDMTAGTTTPHGDQPLLPERVVGGRCESSRALRVTGQGFTDWGVSISGTFRWEAQAEPMDASRYQGVTFWARVGEQNTSVVRVQFQDVNTHPSGGVCSTERGSPDECYNGFGTALPALGEQWRHYKIAFADLAQREFGLRRDALQVSGLYGIEIGLDANSVFDLWLDDFAFYE